MHQRFGGDLQGKKPNGRPRPRLENDIKMNLKKWNGKAGIRLSRFMTGTSVGFL
jgi:hypothetical protein